MDMDLDGGLDKQITAPAMADLLTYINAAQSP